MAIFLNEVLPYDQVLEGEARERLAVRALRSALLLGLAGDLLLRGGGLGINALLLACLTAASVYALDVERGDGATHERLPLLVPIVAAGLAFAWRASEMLSVTAVGFFFLALALHAAALRAGPAWSLWRLDPLAPVRSMLRLAGDATTQGIMLLGRDLPRERMTGTGRLRGVMVGWRGMIAAIPLLLVFNALLMGADPVWAKQAERLIDVDLASLMGHVALTMLLAWFAGGWLRGALLATPAAAPAHGRAAEAPRELRAADVLLPLWMVNALFGAFVALQLRTLAGGAAYVQAAAGLTFAEYARHGFFQLVVVAVLTLPALLVADALTPLDHVARRSVRRAALVALVLVGGILASAALRMKLYLDAYSLTEDRFYASVAIAWIAGVLAWFAMTVLRDRRERFIGGAMVSAFGVWALLVVASPDAIIANANLARLERDGKVDASYLGNLSYDAAPALVAALPRMSAAQRCEVRRALARDRVALEQREDERDWRAWSVAGWRAQRAWQRGGVTSPWVQAHSGCPGDPVPANTTRVTAPAAVPAPAPVIATPAAPPVTP